MMNKIIIIIAILSVLCNADYEKLKEYKHSCKFCIHTDLHQQAAAADKTNLIEIKYYDINDMQTELLEKKYGLVLWLAIADGICIYKYVGNDDIYVIIKQLRKNIANIKSIRKYKKYNFNSY